MWRLYVSAAPEPARALVTQQQGLPAICVCCRKIRNDQGDRLEMRVDPVERWPAVNRPSVS